MKAHMLSIRNLMKLLFWLATSSLTSFCLLFGLPFVSRFAAGKVIVMAGCKPPSFDIQAVCPAGSFAEPFVPLSHWLTSAVAPYLLVKNFGGLLLAWGALCAVLYYFTYRPLSERV
jgi:hypothetical protein